eukprot:TRINITY_DN7055_c0_g1_i1.p1 TRINITY_DN7055_c0_g1~~TRINITY_DN7055_c0_g1_i1.p1  ORF type:complete len:348 (+),score=60.40 TRINITY_DN7055_c0_g1_i1:60-1103(+)
MYKPISGPAAWYGNNLKESDWTYVFTAQDLEEIDKAVHKVVDNNVEFTSINKESFQLATLGPKLEAIQNQILNGIGFILLKGLPVNKYSIQQTAIAYWGIGSYFGVPVPQNKQGHLLGHVRDIGEDPKLPQTRIYTTNARHKFHTDSCDIVGLLCLQKAKSGGLSSVASSVTIYNEMLKRNPQWVDILAKPFYYDRKNEIPDGKGPYYLMPAFNFHKELLSVILACDFIHSAQKRFPELPRLTQLQIEALEMFQSICAEKEVRLDMNLEPGDIQFLHNHQIVHARTSYEDYEEPEKKRHLLRLWLAALNGRELPPVFAERYINIELGTARGGIRCPGQKLIVPLSAS